MRFIMRNSVDNKLEDMGKQKEATIKGAMGDDGARLAELKVHQMIRLFGHEEGQHAFIYSDQPEELA